MTIEEKLEARFFSKSGSFDIFSGQGAFKLYVMAPRRDAQNYIEKEGAILIEAAPASGKTPEGLPIYNWDKSAKMTFALGMQDIEALLEDRDVAKLFHKDQRNLSNPAFDKSLIVSAPSPSFDKWKLVLSDKVQNKSVTVIASEGKILILKRLLIAAVPYLIGWPI